MFAGAVDRWRRPCCRRPFYPLNIDKCFLATLTNISQIYYAKPPSAFAQLDGSTFLKVSRAKNWCSFMGSRAWRTQSAARKTRRRKALPIFLGGRGTRALLISFISRSTSYAVLSRMKTKAGARKLLRGSGHDLILLFSFLLFFFFFFAPFVRHSLRPCLSA